MRRLPTSCDVSAARSDTRCGLPKCNTLRSLLFGQAARARKHNIRITVEALEAALDAPEAAMPMPRPRREKPAEPNVDEAERMRLVKDAAETLGVELPR